MHLEKNFAVMQPYLFPYIGYMSLVDVVDCFVFYDDVFHKERLDQSELCHS